jgi:superfamily II DNA/RNA helicase
MTADSKGSQLFLVDNSDADWKVLRYLHDWCQLAKGLDIATGYFEIGSLLGLKDEWQKVDNIRLLMGDEVSKRTKAAFERSVEDLRGRLDGSIEKEKERNDFLDSEMLEDIEELSPDEYKVDEILDETYLDLDQLAEFLRELKQFKPAHDDKLKALVKLLKTDPILKKHKVLIFSEFMATARYLKKQLVEAGFEDVAEVDSASTKDRSAVIRRFAPYYNRPPQGELFEGLDGETRILISTDVLSEGLNLQDATRLINYDLHWNPVRLMQRIGRVDRRLNPEIEALILAAHPDQKDIRGTVGYWNFLPPDELDNLLRLYSKVSKKTLSEIRAAVEKHIKNTYLKQVQAPIGVRPSLKCWMELS